MKSKPQEYISSVQAQTMKERLNERLLGVRDARGARNQTLNRNRGNPDSHTGYQNKFLTYREVEYHYKWVCYSGRLTLLHLLLNHLRILVVYSKPGFHARKESNVQRLRLLQDPGSSAQLLANTVNSGQPGDFWAAVRQHVGLSVSGSQQSYLCIRVTALAVSASLSTAHVDSPDGKIVCERNTTTAQREIITVTDRN